MSKIINDPQKKLENSKDNRESPEEEKGRWRTKGRRLMIINIVFFVIMSLGILLVPISSFILGSVVISLAFIVSLLYIYDVL